MQSVAGDISKELGSDYDTDCLGNASSVSISTSLDESSLDGLPNLMKSENAKSNGTVMEAVTSLYAAIASKCIYKNDTSFYVGVFKKTWFMN